tara:strand:- start:3226 stop:4227 length:1002 start_codon:yes stop_codon:yes gene_type:complete
MANIALRSPQYKFIAATSATLSVKCTITIDGTLRYTLIKNVTPSTGVNFDISELARDYLNVTYSSTYAVRSIVIATSLQNYAGLNATGSTIGSAVAYTDKGLEAFGKFVEGSNPEPPFTSGAQFLIAPDTNPAHSSLRWQIYAPFGVAGYVGYTNSTGIFTMSSYSTTATTASGQGNICTINRIDCTKYGNGTKIIFINRYGVQQDLWFFLKKVDSVKRSNESFQSNTLDFPDDEYAQYEVKNAPTKLINTTAKQSHILSSGYYPEFANAFFEQLLLSEYVWMERPKLDTTVLEQVPVIVKESNIQFKTSVNDKLIEYTMRFEDAFDYINNIR